jgi:hypothetical protein
MYLGVHGCREEALGRFRVVDRPAAADPGAARLRLGPRRIRRALGMIDALAVTQDGFGVVLGKELGMERLRFALAGLPFGRHVAAPFRIWAMWMNLIGTPMRSAQPF